MDYKYLINLFLFIKNFFFNLKEEENKCKNSFEKIIDCPFICQKRLEINTLIALETYQKKFGFWTPEGYNNGKIEDKNNWYYVRKGLWGEQTISLESSTSKGFFLKLSGSNIKLEKYEDTSKFKESASFIPTPGIEDYRLLSLRPLISPKSYVRHFDGKICNLGKIIFDDYDRDATWRVHTVEDF